ncbi:hypothetical protein [Mucilaginibacter ginsenosidivorans]|uniref:Uncharacterized protein n=1 Tax=Mucilaginibacter ginsenosidivorans TaxID=398053 RepID=A0A5B8V3D8_9SPHI|nr:hypothetical protein [Mucilaginibacter ginsenosidivorans]QEC65333.1 hypothetical protein FRZ54_23090 [Mucilaginibacter ginsenosidivorans]
MNSLPILTFLASIAVMLTTVVQLFISFKSFKKASKSESKLADVVKRVPLLAVAAVLIGVFYLNFYYTSELNKEEKDFEALLLKSHNKLDYQYYMLDNARKKRVIDSLNNYTAELKASVARIKKQQYITGKNTIPISNASLVLNKTNEEIRNIESYNEIINPQSILLNQKGLTTSGTTSNFVFSCPKDRFSEYVDLKLEFLDNKIIDKIACIYLTVYKDTIVNSEISEWSLFEQAYKPKSGINLIKIRNYLRQPKVKLEIGYILKSESLKEYPRFEKVTCE